MVRKITFRTSWCCKCNVGEDRVGSDVTYDTKEARQVTAMVINTARTIFNKIAKTLDDMPKDFPRTKVFVVTDGTRYLAVDPSGYDYPKYKGIVVIKRRKKPVV